ncbi:MAG: hypothetical protein AB1439_05535 [candidate division FCPU426 bacterium]
MNTLPFGTLLYYAACLALWLGLTVMALLVLRRDFIAWLEARPGLRVWLLGTDRMPPARTIQRFYWFLDGGWTWILVWSWWLMPALREYFFRSATQPAALQTARLSSIIVVLSYAATGFFAIGRGITIWYREIYSPVPDTFRRGGERS